MSVLLVGTLDTKGVEVGYVRDRLRAAGVPVLVLDAGVMGPPAFPPDVGRDEVFAAAGTTAEAVRAAGDRGRAVALAAEGAAKRAADLHRQGKLSGVLGLGGSAGTTIGTAAMRALPVGVPKLMVSTMAGGQVRDYVGTRDLMMLHSVVDISGLNRISRAVLHNAAGAMAGMVAGRTPSVSEGVGQHPLAHARGSPEDKPLVAATMFGVTTPCVEAARAVLEAAGYEVLVFHATGTGGRTMEGLVRDGLIAGVLDITTTELADELAGGVLSAGPDRLTAAGEKGVPQVISVGSLDMVNFGPPETVPERYKDRLVYRHNPSVTLMRTTSDEMAALGQELARKAAAARGPTAVMLPLKGVSAIDAEGKAFWAPEADAALFGAVRAGVAADEFDLHINDRAFAEAAARKLLEMMRGVKQD
ncbi:MAG: Tm-1-like ATP-binding domain-containing protein [Gemmataceae bacterium]|nr:Tm-1-like ATP-binding domain-containing protein [Gemmataceae bacterium]